MKKIVVGNFKGGVGKTTTVVTLAYLYALREKRVLVIDTDPQSNTTSMFGTVNVQHKTLLNLVSGDYKNVKSCIYRTKYKNIDIIKCHTELTEEAVTNKNWLFEVEEEVGAEYDICLIDTRPVFENLTESSLVYADILLTPVNMDSYCRDNLALVEERIEKFMLNGLKWYVFENKSLPRSKSQAQNYDDIAGKHNYPLLESCVRFSADVVNASDRKKPVTKHRSKGKSSLDFIDLADELEEKMSEA